MKKIYKRLEQVGVIPVVAFEDPTTVLDVAQALIKGGLNAIEVTFRTDCAAFAISEIKCHFPKMLVGAGTVLTKQQVDQAIEAGADFLVSPGLNPKTVKHALKADVPFIPGCSTPSDVERALELGLDVVKFFPAEAAGGLAMIKAMAAPYTNVRFMPTGGISLDKLESYLKYDRIIACGGSFMVTKELIENGAYDQIEEITRQTAELLHKVRG